MRSDYAEESHGDKARPRHGSPIFYALLQEMAETHDRKSHDYASDENPTGNYRFAGKMALVFKHSSMDAGFFGRIAEKIYRLANLESSGRTPKNETIEDTERDICVITALWMADRRERRMNQNQAIGGANRLKTETEMRSEKAECVIIEVAQDLTDKDLYDSIEYLKAVAENRNRKSPEPGEIRPSNPKRL